jgi:predicted RNA-binding protein YlqC (UPF0109 family)
MKEFLVFIIQSIVDKPEAVSIEEAEEDGQVNLMVKVAQEDMGKVIGKGGKIIKSIRTLLRIRGIKEGKEVNVQLLES